MLHSPRRIVNGLALALLVLLVGSCATGAGTTSAADAVVTEAVPAEEATAEPAPPRERSTESSEPEAGGGSVSPAKPRGESGPESERAERDSVVEDGEVVDANHLSLLIERWEPPTGPFPVAPSSAQERRLSRRYRVTRNSSVRVIVTGDPAMLSDGAVEDHIRTVLSAAGVSASAFRPGSFAARTILRIVVGIDEDRSAINDYGRVQLQFVTETGPGLAMRSSLPLQGPWVLSRISPHDGARASLRRIEANTVLAVIEAIDRGITRRLSDQGVEYAVTLVDPALAAALRPIGVPNGGSSWRFFDLPREIAAVAADNLNGLPLEVAVDEARGEISIVATRE